MQPELIWDGLLDWVSLTAEVFTDPTRRVYWLYLCAAIPFALYALRRREARRRLARSARSLDLRTDILCMLVNTGLEASLVAPLMLSAPLIAESISGQLAALGLELGAPAARGLGAELAFSLSCVLLTDLALTLTHRLFHRVPALWAFHSVHHAAEQLTPLLVYRFHPVETVITGAVLTGVLGITQGLADTCAPGLAATTMSGLNVFVLAFYLLAYNLRHSPLWIDYPRSLRWLLISPAQHQVHHSSAARHQGRNYGFMFSFWDRAFGSLYEPAGHEHLEFGLGAEGLRRPWRLWEVYLLPFQRCYQALTRGPRGAPGSP